MSDRRKHPWFPELERVETRAAGRKLWRVAYNPVLKSWRYWLIALVAQVSCQVALRLGTERFLNWSGLASYNQIWGVAATTVGAALAAILTLWLVRRRITCNLRLELRKLGQPICLACGYDLTGNVSGRCSECGTTINSHPGKYTIDT
ncbi:MAG: hypothetical protein ABIG44_08335 [Planctomycetota bacterium]